MLPPARIIFCSYPYLQSIAVNTNATHHRCRYYCCCFDMTNAPPACLPELHHEHYPALAPR